jgi:hypothetical protein
MSTSKSLRAASGAQPITAPVGNEEAIASGQFALICPEHARVGDIAAMNQHNRFAYSPRADVQVAQLSYHFVSFSM